MLERLNEEIRRRTHVSLERRTARGGRDLIDHPQHPGAHDDLANAVCGVFVMLERDRRPQLISVVDVVGVDGLPPPLPRSQYVFAEVTAEAPKARKGAILVRSGESAVTDNVSDQDRSDLPGLGHPSGTPALRISSMIRSRPFKKTGLPL
jgi:hypothetical protein